MAATLSTWTRPPACVPPLWGLAAPPFPPPQSRESTCSSSALHTSITQSVPYPPTHQGPYPPPLTEVKLHVLGLQSTGLTVAGQLAGCSHHRLNVVVSHLQEGLAGHCHANLMMPISLVVTHSSPGLLPLPHPHQEAGVGPLPEAGPPDASWSAAAHTHTRTHTHTTWTSRRSHMDLTHTLWTSHTWVGAVLGRKASEPRTWAT